MVIKRGKGIIMIFFLAIFLILLAGFVLPDCPKPDYSPHELRAHLRTIVFNYLSDPVLSPYNKNEILDLMEFYKDEKYNSVIADCDVKADPSLSNELISDLLKRTIVFQKECNDGKDNDGDGYFDLNDGGCDDPFDDDETNCGDDVCEGGESCLSCSSDCCLPSEIKILFMKSSGTDAISFRENGDVILKGTLTQETTPVPEDTQDEFIFKDSGGANAAIINLVTGNMVITGTLNDEQVTLTNPPGNDFLVKDSDGNIVSYISESGNFYLKGTLTENGDP